MRFLSIATAGTVWFGLAGVLATHAQEMEPRAYSPAPTGINFALVGYARSDWSAKLAWATGYSTRIGGDFRTASITFQYRWFDR
jgi:hypothetical protein